VFLKALRILEWEESVKEEKVREAKRKKREGGEERYEYFYWIIFYGFIFITIY